MNDQMIISAVTEGDSAALMQYYQLLRPAVLKMQYKYDLDEERIKDAYQEAFVDLVLMIQEGKIEQIEKSITDYFFGIIRLKVLGQLRQQKRYDSIIELAEQELQKDGFIDTVFEVEELTPTQEALKDGILQLGDKCQELIKLFYYKEYSINAIRHRMGYKSEEVVKSHKSRCMKKLKDLVRNGKF